MLTRSLTKRAAFQIPLYQTESKANPKCEFRAPCCCERAVCKPLIPLGRRRERGELACPGLKLLADRSPWRRALWCRVSTGRRLAGGLRSAGAQKIAQHCQHPLVLLAEEGDAARWAACLVKKASELWAQRLLVSKLCPLRVCDAARLAWQGR